MARTGGERLGQSEKDGRRAAARSRRARVPVGPPASSPPPAPAMHRAASNGTLHPDSGAMMRPAMRAQPEQTRQRLPLKPSCAGLTR